jgi:hypothetical protein
MYSPTPHAARCEKAHIFHLCGRHTTHNTQHTTYTQEKAEHLLALLQGGEGEECCICLSALSDPVITTCAHIYCKPCITRYRVLLHRTHTHTHTHTHTTHKALTATMAERWS